MKRRDFIVKSGQVMTVAMFMSAVSNNTLFASSLDEIASMDKKNSNKRPSIDNFKQPILKAIGLGVNAPSPHNTQSWKFKIINDTKMLFYVNEKILLPATDPTTRQIHIGAGCFIETLKIGATKLGFDTNVEYFPEGYENEKDLGVKPVAKIKLIAVETKPNPLAEYIYTRQTNRSSYSGDLVNITEFNEIVSLIDKSFSSLLFINDQSIMNSCRSLFFEAFKMESNTYRTNEETRLMFRYSEEERALKKDGISIPQMGFKGLMKVIAENSLDDGNKKKWHSEKSIKISLKSIKKGVDSSKGFVVWKTKSNTYLDWVKMGQDYVRFSLATTAKGLCLHPYNQVIQEYDEMKTVRDEFNLLMGVEKGEKIQMIVRIGRAKETYYSYRKNVEDNLIKTT